MWPERMCSRMDFIEYLEEDCRRNPDKPFFGFEGVAHTFAEVYGQVQARARALRAEGYGPGASKRLIIDSSNTPEFVVMVLAAAAIGVPVVLLNNRLTRYEKDERLSSLPVRLPTGICAIMFTSGTTGRSKAVALSQRNLVGAALASNRQLNRPGEGLWQLVLPLYHVGGLQVMVRSLVNDSSFILYPHCDVPQVLADARAQVATHISVVDKTLRDMLDIDPSTTASYEAILLGGGPLNAQTVARGQAAHASVYASYGMTETASQIASTLITDGFDGGLTLLDGYEARVLQPDGEGIGELAVRGPGVMEGYVTDDGSSDLVLSFPEDPDIDRGGGAADGGVDCASKGFLLTGDRAVLRGNRIYVRERLSDLFVSGGENVYPAEVERRLCDAPGVAEALVVGVPDDTWGRVPIAFVTARPGCAVDSDSLRDACADMFSSFARPREVFVLDHLPRTTIGKVSRADALQMYRQRIEPVRITLHTIVQPLATPFATANGTMDMRTSLLVEVHDADGNVGYGEDVAFETDWYTPETLDADRQVIEEILVPRVLGRCYLSPGEVAADLATTVRTTLVSDGSRVDDETCAFPMAVAAIENALWDMYGRATGRSMQELIGADVRKPASAGVVLGIDTIEATIATARMYVEAGYGRLKLKIRPDDDVDRVRAIRMTFPDILLMLDANQSYTPDEMEALIALAPYDILCIEEPFDLSRVEGADARFALLSHLQEQLPIPLCLDESMRSAADAHRALSYPDLRFFALKIGRMGGIQPALDFLYAATARGARVWMGGMYETSISKRLHAMFGQIDGMDIPGDITATTRYFADDIAIPPYKVDGGMAILAPAPGLGVTLDAKVMASVTVDRHTFGR